MDRILFVSYALVDPRHRLHCRLHLNARDKLRYFLSSMPATPQFFMAYYINTLVVTNTLRVASE